ncbi:MAG TPA: lysophospholipid acyltransferase family protein, partial [Gemmatimonadales bacterium]|nr:lysophospholipid acyltransferase family protein [Gemmatimonadales bacterium]
MVLDLDFGRVTDGAAQDRDAGETQGHACAGRHARPTRWLAAGFQEGVVYPQSWWRPHLIPWNPAAAENFYRTPILAWLADNWKCIWVRPGRRDLHALHKMIEVLPAGVMTLFPEGTRTRDGSVGPGQAGPGLLILATRARVIPVLIEGMRDVL